MRVSLGEIDGANTAWRPISAWVMRWTSIIPAATIWHHFVNDQEAVAGVEGQTCYRARFVLPIDRPAIRDGVVSVAAGVIQSVTAYSAKAHAGCVDLGDVAIMPGLVNAHTHLEFSDLPRPIGEPRMTFPAWIEKVIAHRRAQVARYGGEPDALAKRREHAIANGTAEALATGTTTLGDIRRAGAGAVHAGASPFMVAFQESIALAA